MGATGWGFLAAILAIGTEYLYRTLPGAWLSHLYAWVPLQLGIGYCVYRLVTTPNTSLVDAFIVWAFSTASLRLFVSLVLLHDTIHAGTWVAFGLVLGARVVQLVWR